jgi:hypothetical protein
MCFVYILITNYLKTGHWREYLGAREVQMGSYTNEELHSLYRSPSTFGVAWRLRWAGHVARMEEVRSAFKILTANLLDRDL